MVKFLTALSLIASIAQTSYAQEILEDGYYTLSSRSSINAYLYISTDSALLHWEGSDGTFEFVFENPTEVVSNDDGFTEHKYAEPEGYDLYPSFAYKRYTDQGDVLYEIEFRVFDKTFKKIIAGTKYYEYGSEKSIGTCCAPMKRFETLEELRGR